MGCCAVGVCSKLRERPRTYYVLIMLVLCHVINQVDRYALAVVSKEMENTLYFGDRQGGGYEYDVLVGSIFTIVFIFAGVPISVLSDSPQRIRILALSLVVCSLATMFMGAATAYWQLVVLRVLQGAAQSASTPIACSVLVDTVSKNNRSAFLSIYEWGFYMGLSLVFGLGNYILHDYGYRAVLYLAGMPGLLISVLLLLTVRNPPPAREGVLDSESAALSEKLSTLSISGSIGSIEGLYTAIRNKCSFSSPLFVNRSHSLLSLEARASLFISDSDADSSGFGATHDDSIDHSQAEGQAAKATAVWGARPSGSQEGRGATREGAGLVRFLFCNRQSLPFWGLCATAAIRDASGLVWGYNAQRYLRETLEISIEDIGPWMAWVPLVFGPVGAMAGALIANRVAVSFGRHRQIWVLAVSQLSCAVTAMGVLDGDFPGCFLYLALTLLLGEVWVGAALGIIADVSPRRLRVSMVAFYMFFTTLVGGNATLLVSPLEEATGSHKGALKWLFPFLFLLNGCLLTVAGFCCFRRSIFNLRDGEGAALLGGANQ